MAEPNEPRPEEDPLTGKPQQYEGRIRKAQRMQWDSNDIRECNAAPKVDVAKMLGSVFHTRDKEKKDLEVIKGKAVGIFLWSHTCDICETFAGALAKVYCDLLDKGGGDALEVVAVTDVADDSDEDSKAMWAAFQKHGPWVTVPFDDEEARHRVNDWATDLLGDSPSGSGPSFIMLDKDGHVLNKRGLLSCGSGADQFLSSSSPCWQSPPVGDLSRGPFAMHTDIALSPAIVVLAEKCSRNVVKNITTTMSEVQKKLYQKSGSDAPIFLIGTSTGSCKGASGEVFAALGNGCETWGRGWTSRAIRAWCSEDRCKKPDTRPLLLYVNVTEDAEAQGYCMSNATLITSDKIEEFLGDASSGKLPLKPFDYSQFTETFEYVSPEEAAKYQPLTGTVTEDGCYVGGTWDDFGVEGVSGAINLGGGDSDSDSEASTSSGGSDHHAALLSQFKAANDHKAPKKVPKKQAEESLSKLSPEGRSHEELCKAVATLEDLVSSQQQIISDLVKRIEHLESPQKNVQVAFNEDTVRETGGAKKWKSEDDEATDSDDSEVAAYRKAKVTKEQAPDPEAFKPADETKKWKSEDDETTDSDDSEVAAYREAKAAKQVPAPVTFRPADETKKWKSEDDETTDSDDSEVAAYRKAKEGNATLEATAAENEAEDWTCETCRGFNWSGVEKCVHCV